MEPTNVDLERDLKLKLDSAKAKTILAERISKSTGNAGYVVIELTSMGGSTGVQLFSTGPEILNALVLAGYAMRACKVDTSGGTG
jgi:hypothetical protein